MKEILVVGHDDSDASTRAVDLAARRASASGGSVIVVHVLEWSPYSFLTNEELAERHSRRQSELGRAEKLLEPVAERVRAAGAECRTMVRYGKAPEILSELAEEHDATGIVVGRTGESELMGRLLGSTVFTLAQAAPVALTVVP